MCLNPETLSGRLFQSLGAKYEKVISPLVDFPIQGTTKSPEFCDLRERVGPFRALYAINNILQLIRNLIGSQCRDVKLV